MFDSLCYFNDNWYCTCCHLLDKIVHNQEMSWNERGYNNNPTALQFKAVCTRLLMRHRIKTTGNFIIQDNKHILSVMPDTSSLTDIHIMRKYDLLERQPIKKIMIMQMSPTLQLHLRTSQLYFTTLPVMLSEW